MARRPSGVAAAWAAGLAAGAMACGPIVTIEDGDGTSEMAASSTSSAASTTLLPPFTASTTAVDDWMDTTLGDGQDTSSIRLDLSVPPDPDPGQPPDTCTAPDGLLSDLNGTTPLGDVHMGAAVFAETGGNMCPWAYRVVLAPDLEQLIDVIISYETPMPVPSKVEIELEIPPEGPVPGQWIGSARHGTNLGIWLGEATAEIAYVTRLDDPMPMIEGYVWLVDPMGSGMIEGAFSATYCNIVHGYGCGA